MITPVNGKIVVSCNMKQKEEMTIAGVSIKCCHQYGTNYRERSPVVCVVEQGNKWVKTGEILLVHHNTLYTPSPYHLEGNLFSIPFAKTLFAKIGSEGQLEPICGNILCDRVDIETTFELPPDERKQHIDRVKVTDPGWTKYKIGQLLFTRPHSYYQIVYIWNGIETRVHKCHEEMVVGMTE